jgi:YHS domain-containing protein
MKKKIILVIVAVWAGISSFAQQPATFIQSGKAIRGYDPVAYFSVGKPVKGDSSLSLKWNNANWYFSSKKNLDLFRAHPEKYAPQYGGYCAFGLSNGYKAPTDPNAWTIVNGKLYLNYNLDVRADWDKERAPRIEKADQNWPRIKDK